VAILIELIVWPQTSHIILL